PHYRIAELERLMSEELGEREVLMSLKLGYDAERLLRLIENEYLADELFLKLLKLWRWEADDLMEGESDARILSALLKRFLDAGNYESDIYYSPVSLLRLIRETESPEVLGALVGWPGFTFRQQRGRSITLHEVIASREGLDRRSIEALRRRKEAAVDRALAANQAIGAEGIESYLARHDGVLDRALAANAALAIEHFAELAERGEAVAEALAAFQRIDTERLEILIRHFGWKNLPEALAENPRIDPEAFERILAKSEESFRRRLAANPALPPQSAERLTESEDERILEALASNPAVGEETLRKIRERFGEKTERIDEALAANPSTPAELLEAFYETGREPLLTALAGNPSTPMEILHQLKLDFRFYPSVSQNPTFVDRANFEMGMR
ncbi:hypothetical protein, partial [Nitratifractor sp.]|uniref:hypothetical protein n=1 Tax=Nitratifractor sp. TaxID=2268144 RepID=UPI0025E443AB